MLFSSEKAYMNCCEHGISHWHLMIGNNKKRTEEDSQFRRTYEKPSKSTHVLVCIVWHYTKYFILTSTSNAKKTRKERTRKLNWKGQMQEQLMSLPILVCPFSFCPFDPVLHHKFHVQLRSVCWCYTMEYLGLTSTNNAERERDRTRKKANHLERMGEESLDICSCPCSLILNFRPCFEEVFHPYLDSEVGCWCWLPYLRSTTSSSCMHYSFGKLSQQSSLLCVDAAGGPLVDVLQQRTTDLSLAQVLQIFYQTCSAVCHMHTQSPPIIHRDLKVSTSASLCESSFSNAYKRTLGWFI